MSSIYCKDNIISRSHLLNVLTVYKHRSSKNGPPILHLEEEDLPVTMKRAPCALYSERIIEARMYN